MDPRFLTKEEVKQELASSISAASESLTSSLTGLSNISDGTSQLRIARDINTIMELLSRRITDASGQSQGSEISV